AGPGGLRVDPSLEQLSWRDFDFFGDLARDWNAAHRAARPVASDAGDGQGAARYLAWSAAVELTEDDRVANTALALFAHEQVNLDRILEAERMAEIAVGMDARPAD